MTLFAGFDNPEILDCGAVCYPLGLLQLFRKLFQRSGMPLSYLLDLSFVVFSLLINGLLKLCNLLFTLGPTKLAKKIFSNKCPPLVYDISLKCRVQYLSSC